MDVAIVGIGIHPFGRTDGLTGLEQGVYAARKALDDAGLEWSDIEFAYGGTGAAEKPDTNPSPEQIMRPYVYLMDAASEGVSGISFDAQPK